jgi:hypothetical protein
VPRQRASEPRKLLSATRFTVSLTLEARPGQEEPLACRRQAPTWSAVTSCAVCSKRPEKDAASAHDPWSTCAGVEAVPSLTRPASRRELAQRARFGLRGRQGPGAGPRGATGSIAQFLFLTSRRPRATLPRQGGESLSWRSLCSADDKVGRRQDALATTERSRPSAPTAVTNLACDRSDEREPWFHSRVPRRSGIVRPTSKRSTRVRSSAKVRGKE